MFEPPPLTLEQRAALYRSLIAEFVAQKGLALPGMAEWAGPLVAELDHTGMALKSIAVRLRRAGTPLSVAERTALGLPPRLPVGGQFAAALMPRGLADIALTAEAIAAWPIRHHGRQTMRGVINYDRVPVRLIIFRDDRTCAAARPLIGQTVRWNRVPEFPLPDCDKLLCRCSFDRAPPPRPTQTMFRPHRRHRKPKGCAVALLALGAAAAAATALAAAF